MKVVCIALLCLGLVGCEVSAHVESKPQSPTVAPPDIEYDGTAHLADGTEIQRYFDKEHLAFFVCFHPYATAYSCVKE